MEGDEPRNHINTFDRDFEYFIRDLWKSRGYDATVTQQSRDGGVDVIAKTSDETLAIEVKYRGSGKVGTNYVREIAGVATKPNFDRGVLVTDGEFTSDAHKEAHKLGVQLYDRDDLVETLNEYYIESDENNIDGLLKRTLKVPFRILSGDGGLVKAIGRIILITVTIYVIWLFLNLT